MNIGTELDILFDPTFFPATRDELLDVAIRDGGSREVIELLQGLDDDDYLYRSISEVNPINNDLSDFFNNDDE